LFKAVAFGATALVIVAATLAHKHEASKVRATMQYFIGTEATN
jgi:hypothetical protein